MRTLLLTLLPLTLLLAACGPKTETEVGVPGGVAPTEEPAGETVSTEEPVVGEQEVSDEGDESDEGGAGDAGEPVDEAPPGDAHSEPLVQDGGACVDAGDCRSGICEGIGCGSEPMGVCAPASRACTRDLRPYCGCDGQTFRTSGSCPGKRFSAKGMCEGDQSGQLKVPVPG